MSGAYVDTSALVAIAFNEPDSVAVARRLKKFSRLLSSNLLEAEMRTAFTREGREFDEKYLLGLDWVLPDRPLSNEFRTVLEAGYVRGADLWHLATALYMAREPEQVSFVTLDNRRQTVAGTLGFHV